MKKYIGTIVAESLINPEVIQTLGILGSEVSPNLGWHIYKVSVNEDRVKSLAKEIIDNKWYMHFWNEREIIAVFKDKTFTFNSDDKPSRINAVNYGISLGIPEEQLDFIID